jgi:uncharacterized repeat protein (TIGR04076 family)
MFQVKATLVRFLGDEEKYPCHFCHKIGDELIFDGEKYLGRLCPDVWPILTPKVSALHQAGPRYVEAVYYYPFWYAPPSVRDASKKKYDGLGFANVFKTHLEPQFHMATLAPPNAFKWPPHGERTVARAITVICPDIRTCAVFVLVAFDLSEKGFDMPFFRRQMAILDRVLKNQGVAQDSIIEEFSKEEREGIYPPLVSEILFPLVEELALMGYMEIKGGDAFVTERGAVKLQAFRNTLSAEERDALGV